MRKFVITEMTDSSVSVTIRVLENSDSDQFAPYTVSYEFPFSLVNPRVALQISTLLVSDPSIPDCNGKEENK